MNDLEIDCKGVSKRDKDKSTELRILKDLQARPAEVLILNRLDACGSEEIKAEKTEGTGWTVERRDVFRLLCEENIV